MESDAASPRHSGRSTWRVLGTLFLVVAVGLTALGACVAAYVGSTPRRTLEVPRAELAVRVPKFYPLPSMGADASGQTRGVWVTLDDDGTATAFFARDPQSGCTVPWRPEMKFEDTTGVTTGVYRDPCSGSTYNRDGAAIFGPTPRGLDVYEASVDARHIVVDLARVRLGLCRAVTVTDCSPPGTPVYRSTPPPPLVTPRPAGS